MINPPTVLYCHLNSLVALLSSHPFDLTYSCTPCITPLSFSPHPNTSDIWTLRTQLALSFHILKSALGIITFPLWWQRRVANYRRLARQLRISRPGCCYAFAHSASLEEKEAR